MYSSYLASFRQLSLSVAVSVKSPWKKQGLCINIKLTWSQVWFAGLANNQDLWFDYFLFKTAPFMKYNQGVS